MSDGNAPRLQFDTRDGVAGWNDLGVFELPAGTIRVVASDDTAGDVVVADAIR